MADTRRRQAAAWEVSGQAARVFLYARFALRVLEGMHEDSVDQPGWQAKLPRDVGAAGLHQVFARDLERFDDPVLVREVLAPLAFARGKGLPRRQVWPALATALSRTGRGYRDCDVAGVIRDAGWYLTEATEDGQAVFRLYHQAIADYLRQEVTRTEAEVEDVITRRLRELAEADGWPRANPYTTRHLASHAAAGTQLRDLAGDLGYLVAADPDGLAAALGTGLDPGLPASARCTCGARTTCAGGCRPSGPPSWR